MIILNGKAYVNSGLWALGYVSSTCCYWMSNSCEKMVDRKYGLVKLSLSHPPECTRVIYPSKLYLYSSLSADSSTPMLQLKDVFLCTKGELMLFQLWRSPFEGMKKDNTGYQHGHMDLQMIFAPLEMHVINESRKIEIIEDHISFT